MPAVLLAGAVAALALARLRPVLGRPAAGGAGPVFLRLALAAGGLGALTRLLASLWSPGGWAEAALLAAGAALIGLFAPAALGLAGAAGSSRRALLGAAALAASASGCGLLALAFVRVDRDALSAAGVESGIGLLSAGGPPAWAHLFAGAVAALTALCVLACAGAAARAWYGRYVGRGEPAAPAAGWLVAAALVLAASGPEGFARLAPAGEWVGQAMAWLLVWRGAALALAAEAAPLFPGRAPGEAWEG